MSIASSNTPAKGNPLAFSLETPKLGAHVYTHIFDPDTGVAPLPHQIIDDISGVMHALHIIKEHKGVFVPGLAIRTRRRYLRNPQGNDQRGGKRTKFFLLSYLLVDRCPLDFAGIAIRF